MGFRHYSGRLLSDSCDKLQCLIEVIFFLSVCVPVFLCLSEINGNIDRYFCVYCADATLIELLLFVPYWNVCFRGFGERWLNSWFLQRIKLMLVNVIICHCYEIYLISLLSGTFWLWCWKKLCIIACIFKWIMHY